jgi:hypothetical protein
MESNSFFYDCGVAGCLAATTFDNILYGYRGKSSFILINDGEQHLGLTPKPWDPLLLQSLVHRMGPQALVVEDAVVSKSIIPRVRGIEPCPEVKGTYNIKLNNGSLGSVSPAVMLAVKGLLPMVSLSPTSASSAPPTKKAWLISDERTSSPQLVCHYPDGERTHHNIAAQKIASFVERQMQDGERVSFSLGRQHFSWSASLFQHIRCCRLKKGCIVVLELNDHKDILLRLMDVVLYPAFVQLLKPHLRDALVLNEKVTKPVLVPGDQIQAVLHVAGISELSFVVQGQLYRFACSDPKVISDQLPSALIRHKVDEGWLAARKEQQITFDDNYITIEGLHLPITSSMKWALYRARVAAQ